MDGVAGGANSPISQQSVDLGLGLGQFVGQFVGLRGEVKHLTQRDLLPLLECSDLNE